MIPIVLLVAIVVVVVIGLYFGRKSRKSDRRTKAHESSEVCEVVVKENEYHQFVIDGTINEVPVKFLIDTGANVVSIPGNIALGLNLGSPTGLPSLAQTAGGEVPTFGYELNRVAVGPISLHGVKASVNMTSYSPMVLLGMTFLNRIEVVSRDGIMTLIQDSGQK